MLYFNQEEIGMAKSGNQKLKMLYLAQIFTRETDDTHRLTVNDIISKLGAYGINSDRKTIYSDLEELMHFGMDIVKERDGRNWYYYLGKRDFELPELKLLVDSVQSAKFISNRKSDELIGKLESLLSSPQAKLLDRQVFISGRVKAMNESIYYNVDKIHEAIGRKRQIKFRYFRWNIKKNTELKKDGQFYVASPWALVWEDENYYLVAYDSKEEKIKHFRVDKMLSISVTDLPREGEESFREFRLPEYTNRHFGMYGGEEKTVTLEADNDMIGIFIDRFGKDIPVMPADGNRFRTRVNVAVSTQFFGWVFGLGENVKIIKPKEVADEMKEKIERILENYK